MTWLTRPSSPRTGEGKGRVPLSETYRRLRIRTGNADRANPAPAGCFCDAAASRSSPKPADDQMATPSRRISSTRPALAGSRSRVTRGTRSFCVWLAETRRQRGASWSGPTKPPPSPGASRPLDAGGLGHRATTTPSPGAAMSGSQSSTERPQDDGLRPQAGHCRRGGGGRQRRGSQHSPVSPGRGGERPVQGVPCAGSHRCLA